MEPDGALRSLIDLYAASWTLTRTVCGLMEPYRALPSLAEHYGASRSCGTHVRGSSAGGFHPHSIDSHSHAIHIFDKVYLTPPPSKKHIKH